MRSLRLAAVAAIVVVSGCSQRQAGNYQPAAEDVSAPKMRYEPTAPGVDVTAAPGVAFNYRYAFRLPGNRISEVQEAHAQACEKLGVTKCRITGMRYRLVNQKDIEAMLALRLDPALARNFGKDATSLVTKADGMLVDQEITGEDVGSRIAGAARSAAQLREELAKIEAELNRPVPMVRGNVAPQAAVDRQSLLNRATEIRQQLASLSESKQADEEALAGTPMVFNYGSGSVVPGFDVRSPIRDAISRAGDNLVSGFAVILMIIISLIPWAILGAALFYLWRFVRRRFGNVGEGYLGQSQVAEPPSETPSRRPRRKADQG